MEQITSSNIKLILSTSCLLTLYRRHLINENQNITRNLTNAATHCKDFCEGKYNQETQLADFQPSLNPRSKPTYRHLGYSNYRTNVDFEC